MTSAFLFFLDLFSVHEVRNFNTPCFPICAALYVPHLEPTVCEPKCLQLYVDRKETFPVYKVITSGLLL